MAAWRLGLPLSGSPQEAVAEQIEVGPPKHLTFQHFQAVDVPLNGTRTPRQGHPSFDGITSSLPILEEGEYFPRVIGILAPLCSHYKISL
jgi:hypothetical protein